MKIGFLRHSLLSRGGDRMVLEYAGYLAEKGQDVTIWVNEINTVFSINPLVKIRYLKLKHKLGTIMKAVFTRFPSDIIIADIVAMAFFLSLRNSRKIVYFAQDYDESYYRAKGLQLLIRILYVYCLKIKHIPVVSVSNSLADFLRQRYGVNPKVVLNGIDQHEFYPDPDEDLCANKTGRRAILIFSRKDYRKGLDIAIDVLRKINHAGLKGMITVWAVGECLNIPDLTMHNLGFVAHQQLRKIFSSSDIFFFPTRHEGFPLMVLQAMACGCVVVTTSAVEFAEDGKNALVTEPQDSEGAFMRLKEAILDDHLREALKENAFETAKFFSLSKSKEDFYNAIMP